MCSILIEKKMMHIHYNVLYGHILAYDPSPKDHEISNFGRLLLGRHYYILYLSDPYPSVDKRRRNIAFLFYGHAQTQEPLPWGS